MNMLKLFFVTLSFSLVCTQAMSQSVDNSAASKKVLTRVQKDSIQIRTFEGNYQDLLKAIVGALHNLGYEEIKADSGVGLITGSLPEEDISDSVGARTAGAVASALTLGIVGNDDKTTVRNRDATILVSSTGPKSAKVKVTLKQTTTTDTENWVSSTKKEVSDLTDTPKAYDDIFKEIASQYGSLGN